MSVIKLGYPAEVKDWLYRFLPSADRPFVNVTPLDREHVRCPVYRADHYEVWSRYVDSSHELESLEQAFAKVPGVYMTTQVFDLRRHPGDQPGLPRCPRHQSSWRTVPSRGLRLHER